MNSGIIWHQLMAYLPKSLRNWSLPPWRSLKNGKPKKRKRRIADSSVVHPEVFRAARTIATTCTSFASVQDKRNSGHLIKRRRKTWRATRLTASVRRVSTSSTRKRFDQDAEYLEDDGITWFALVRKDYMRVLLDTLRTRLQWAYAARSNETREGVDLSAASSRMDFGRDRQDSKKRNH